MKTALMSLVLLASINSYASSSTLEYRVGAPRVLQGGFQVDPSDVRFCPTFESLVVTQNEKLQGLLLTFSEQGEVIGPKSSGSTKTCISDMVCPTEDHFDFVDRTGYASLTRNNDGDYPTKNLPGYSSLSVSLTNVATRKGRVDCYYSIKAQ